MKTDIRPKFHVCSTHLGESLVFVTAEEYAAYNADQLALAKKHRAIIREKYGIYAPNQDRFVADAAQNPYTNAGQATVNGFANNLSYEKPTIEELNRTITGIALQNTPFDAVHPALSGRRNRPIPPEDESIALGPAPTCKAKGETQ